ARISRKSRREKNGFSRRRPLGRSRMRAARSKGRPGRAGRKGGRGRNSGRGSKDRKDGLGRSARRRATTRPKRASLPEQSRTMLFGRLKAGGGRGRSRL